jgi:sialidase-1
MRLLVLSALLSTTFLRAAEPFLEKLDLFVAGEDPAYKVCHIPGVVVTAKGTVLAWCEVRKRATAISDWDDNRILLRRSTDDGKTWSAPRSIADVPGPKTKNPSALRMKNVNPADVTYNNPVLIADRDGTVHMLFCLEYMRCFYQRSDDDGLTWSTPTEITAAFEGFRKAHDWKVLATGPNHGIQLRNGRLLTPVWISAGTGSNSHHPSVAGTLYSDDHGATWHAGDIAVPTNETWIDPNEATAVELSDGRVMLNVRNESKPNRRLVTISDNGATGWSTPRFDEALWEPVCMASLIRYDFGGQKLLLFSNPHNLEKAKGKAEPGKYRDRKNISVKISRDEGQTWISNKIIEAGPGMYSDLAVTHAGTILCFYGRSGESQGAATGLAAMTGGRLTLARFNLEWLSKP